MNKLSSIFEQMEIQYTVKGKNCLRLLNYQIIIEEYIKRGEKVDPRLFYRIFRLLTNEKELEGQTDENKNHLIEQITDKVQDRFKHIYFEGKKKEPSIPNFFWSPNEKVAISAEVNKFSYSTYSLKDLVRHTIRKCIYLSEKENNKKEVLNEVYAAMESFAESNFNKKHQKEIGYFFKVRLAVYIALELSLYEETKVPSSGDFYTLDDLFQIGNYSLKHWKNE